MSPERKALTELSGPINLFTALAHTPLHQRMPLGYKPPVFREAGYISGVEIHSLAVIQNSASVHKFPNKLELLASFFGSSILSSFGGRV